jgi:uncharacterized protein (TIGR00661 family)
MKILFAIQGTGNGHISRAREIVPLLQQYGEVDLLISGTEAEVGLSQPLKYKFHGFSFVSLSHQCSFVSPNTPRVGHSTFAELIFKYYSPTTHHIGFHFDRYADFIHTPVIRSEIRAMETKTLDHYSVYLPAYNDKKLTEHLKKTDVEWHVFSKRQKTAYRDGNVHIIPVNNEGFNTSLANCRGLLTGGGFEGPAEALYLGKKVMMIPMKGQYEQQCNALAASKLGVPVVQEINDGFSTQLEKWLNTPNTISVNFPNETAQIVENMVKMYAR